MYVMAAVVMDSDELENLMMNPPSGGVLNMGGGIFSELPWKKVKSEKICQEHVLCVVKMHKGGTLEVTPGLSEEEPRFARRHRHSPWVEGLSEGRGASHLT